MITTIPELDERALEADAERASRALAEDMRIVKDRAEHVADVAAPLGRALTVVFAAAIALVALGLFRSIGGRRAHALR